MRARAYKADFISRLQDNEIGQKIFDHLPDVCFFLKDLEGRFVSANQTFLKKFGWSEEELIGRTDFDLGDVHSAESYRLDDEKVMRSGVPQISKHEIIASSNGSLEWFQTTKIPLRGKDGMIIGLVGFSRDLHLDNSSLHNYRAMEPVIRHILNHYSRPIRIFDLAEIAGMTGPRFIRHFKKEFQMPPSRYITLVRLNAASRMLSGSRKSISDIALDVGFYDHSYFTKQFIKHKNTTPTEYRAKHEGQPQRFKPKG